MADDRNQKIERIQLAKKIGLIVSGLVLLYLIIGFWVVAPLLKPRLEDQLSSRIGRKTTIDEIKINPLVLSVTIYGLNVHEIDGQPFSGFANFYANAQLSSIFKWALTIKEIRIREPFGVLKLLPQNKLNIDDILAKLSEPKTEPMEADKGFPRAIIEKFQISDGKAAFENLSGKEPIREEISPISFTVENLSTLEGRVGEYRFAGVGPLGGKFEIDGQIKVNPVRVQGRAAITSTHVNHYWEHFKELFSFQVISGRTDMSGEYTLEIADGHINARLENGTFEIDDFKLAEKGKEDALIAFPAFSIKGIEADSQAREVKIESIETADGRIHSWLSPEGTFELQQIFLQDIEKWNKEKKAEDPEPAPTKPWQVALKKMAVKNWELAFEDRTLKNPAKLIVDNVDMVAKNLSNAKEQAATLGLSMRLNQTGGIEIEGTATMVPLQADLYVVTSEIALKSFQPYVDDAVHVQIHSGTTSSTGRIRYRGTDGRPQIRYEGDLSIDNVGIKDRVHTEDFITLTQLTTQGIGLELRPNRLKVAQMLIDRPSAQVTVDQAGVVNVVSAFTPVEQAASIDKGTDNLLKRLVNFLLVQFKGPMPMSVDRVELKTFVGDFVDASISPSYKTHLEITDAVVTGLSSDSSTKADFNFNGKIDGKARLEGSGQMNPMNALQYSKANVSLKDFALPPVSPYSGKFIGYRIDHGTLNMDLKYQVDKDTVDGNNIIVVDKLELGDPVDSPDALNLPIKLGVALLKDGAGRIKLQAPVKGNVKDPQFDFAKTIQSALTGTIEDAGNAPFATITEVDGFTGEALSRVAFAFGFSELQDREIQKLDALATFLKERKTLFLGVLGTADRQMDRTAIIGESPKKNSPVEKTVPADETPVVESITDQEDDERLEQLARERAEAVRSYLVEQAGIDFARINVLPVQINDGPDSGKGFVEFSLSVQ